MLRIKKHLNLRIWPVIMLSSALLLLGSGLYVLLLVSAPVIYPVITMKPIDIETLEQPDPTDQRIIIPKIGVDMDFEEGDQALDNGAQWRYPNRGNPETGGNFIIAAHRFTLAPTPQGTVRKSPLYHIDKLEVGDQILVYYGGKSYVYAISETFDVKPTQIEIEAPSSTDKLTLYSCGLGGADDSRVVLVARPVDAVGAL